MRGGGEGKGYGEAGFGSGFGLAGHSLSPGIVSDHSLVFTAHVDVHLAAMTSGDNSWNSPLLIASSIDFRYLVTSC